MMPKIIQTIGLLNAGTHGNWQLNTTIGLFASVVAISIVIFKRVHWSGSLLFMLSACSGIFLAFGPISPFEGFPNASREIIASEASQSVVFLMCITIPILFMGAREIIWMLYGFQALCVIDSVMMLYNYFFNGGANGFMNNPSVNATFVSMTFPLLLFRSNMCVFLCVLPISAIIIAGSSTGWSAMLLIFICYAFFSYKKSFLKPAIIGIFGALSSVGIYIIYILSGFKMQSGNGRFFVWRETIAYYLERGNYWFGNGSGTWKPLMWEVQQANVQRDIYLHAHSEPVQILFDQGIIGLELAIILWGFMLKKAIENKNSWLCTTVMVLGLCTLTQFPFRLYFLALFYSLVCRICFMENAQ